MESENDPPVLLTMFPYFKKEKKKNCAVLGDL